MVNKISLIIVLLSLCFIFTSCGCDKDKTSVVNNNSQSGSTQQTTSYNSSSQTSDNIDEVISSYQPPAKVFDIDLSNDDPSNDDIRFEYDDKGRISNCIYKINDIEYNQVYTYDDSKNTVIITTYSNNTIVDEKVIELSEHSDNDFFDVVDGYYVNKIDNAEDSKNWKKLYLDYIDKYVAEYGDNGDSYNLIFVNDDEIPELIICGLSHVTWTHFCWVYNDKLSHLNVDWAGSNGVTYIEKSGLLRVCGMWQGSGQDTIYNFNGKDTDKISSGKCDYILSSFAWENKNVSENEYNKFLNSVFDTSKAKSVIDNSYTKDEITTIINDY